MKCDIEGGELGVVTDMVVTGAMEVTRVMLVMIMMMVMMVMVMMSGTDVVVAAAMEVVNNFQTWSFNFLFFSVAQVFVLKHPKLTI